MFDASETYKAYIDFDIFNLYFMAVICKNFRFD